MSGGEIRIPRRRRRGSPLEVGWRSRGESKGGGFGGSRVLLMYQIRLRNDCAMDILA